jgi:hypothetical protein
MRRVLLVLGAAATLAGATAWEWETEERYYVCSKPGLPPFAVPVQDITEEQTRGYSCQEAGRDRDPARPAAAAVETDQSARPGLGESVVSADQ